MVEYVVLLRSLKAKLLLQLSKGGSREYRLMSIRYENKFRGNIYIIQKLCSEVVLCRYTDSRRAIKQLKRDNKI